ncbi:MAG: acylphosphatase [Candidatus Brockarchaeota archaeon]|nr:acylphosphatase [Candidatus Brockarchaeota archaeon]
MRGKAEKAFTVRVEGRVQRVGYRRFILDAAQEAGVSGYVKNEDDGSVTVFAQGDEERLKTFLERIRAPPPPVVVKSFVEKPSGIRPGLKYFRIRFGPLAEELQEGFGSMEKEFRDYREEFRGFVGEFRDYRGEFRGFVGEFRDYRNEFRDFVGEFRDYRNEFRDFAKKTDENFKLLMDKYGEISEKLTRILETLQRESLETRRELTRAIDTLSELVGKLVAERAGSTSQRPAREEKACANDMAKEESDLKGCGV